MAKTKTLRGIALLALLLVLFQCKSSTPVSKKAYEGNLNAVKKLINEGCDINAYDKWGWTPLMWACHYSNYDIAETLLEKGADPNIQASRSYGSLPIKSTPLMIAVYHKHVMMVKLLLKHNASKSLTDIYGRTAAKFAAKTGKKQIIDLVSEQ